MNYRNDSAGINSHHYYNSLINKIRGVYSGINRFSIRPGIDINYDWVRSESYEEIKNRSDIALFSEFNYEFHKKFQSSLVMREDLIDGKFMPFIAALGANYKPFNSIDFALQANLSRNFRFPTLNELYWKDFGNPELKPETDFSAELGLIYRFINKKETFFLETELTGYYTLINQLIQWIITGNTTKPENASEVLSRGIEAGLNLSWKIAGFSFSLQNNYHYCRSTYQKPSSTSPNDNSVGKQQIYIPMNTLNSNLDIKKWGFYLNYNFTFTGLRYTDRDNSHYMPGYNLSNIILGKSFLFKKYNLSLQMQINNLFDLALRTISNVAMPGRNYALTCRFNFRK
jgi:iron complex outermembrane receptor protein